MSINAIPLTGLNPIKTITKRDKIIAIILDMLLLLNTLSLLKEDKYRKAMIRQKIIKTI